MSHAPAARQHTHCQNCGTALQGPYCHHCGQHDFDASQSFGHMLHEALENLFHFDAKLFRNLITLLFRPGRLSAEFNAGKRAAQMPPFRLYLFVSVLFFFVSFINGGSSLGNQAPPKAAAPIVRAGETRAVPGGTKASPAGGERTAPLKGVRNYLAKEKDANAEWLEAKGRRIAEHPEEMVHLFFAAIPKLLLICLPFFALLTWLLFRRAEPAYLAHLVVALHFHSFIYLWRLVGNGWVFLLGLASPTAAHYLGIGVNLWLLVYPFLMLRQLFHNPWPRTLVKAGALFAGYLAVVGLGFVLTAIVLFLMI